MLGEVQDRFNEVIQPRAQKLGLGCKCDLGIITILSEEMIRGSVFFAISMVVEKIESLYRSASGLQNWLVISLALTQQEK